VIESRGGGGSTRLAYETWFAGIRPGSKQIETLLLPNSQFPPWGSGLPPVAVFPNRFLFFFPDQVLVYERSTKRFATTLSPLKSPRPLVIGNRLLLYNAESFLETASDLKEFKVLASVRRRPALNPLDNLPSFEKATFSQLGTNAVLAVTDEQVLRFENGQWEAAPVEPGDDGRPGSEFVPVTGFAGESLVRRVSRGTQSFPRHRAYYFGPAFFKGQLWWEIVETGRQLIMRNQPPPTPAAGLYSKIPGLAPFAHMNGRSSGMAWANCFTFHGRLFTMNFPVSHPGEVRIDCWPPEKPAPFSFPVPFPEIWARSHHFLDAQVVLSADDIYLLAPPLAGVIRLDGRKLLENIDHARSESTDKPH
jgi:hypothetical protein